MQQNGGILPTCPAGWSRYGDGSACFNGNDTYPVRCTLWGNPSLLSCDRYKSYRTDAAQTFFDDIASAGPANAKSPNDSYFTDF